MEDGREVLRVVSGVRRREKPDEQEDVDRRRIPDTTTCRKPPYFGRTIAFIGIGSRAWRFGDVAGVDRAVASRRDVTAESPLLQSS